MLTLGESEKKLPFLYDNNSLHFNTRVFVKEFCMHMIFPFNLPFVNPCHRYTFNEPNPLIFWLNWVFPMLWLCIYSLLLGWMVELLSL